MILSGNTGACSIHAGSFCISVGDSAACSRVKGVERLLARAASYNYITQILCLRNRVERESRGAASAVRSRPKGLIFPGAVSCENP